MRRLFTYLFVALLVFMAIRAMHGHPARYAPSPPAHWRGRPGPHEDAARRHRELAAEARRNAQKALAEARRAMEEAQHEVHQAWLEVRAEVGRTYREARDEIRHAYREAVADNDDRPTLPPPPPAPAAAPALEDADGLPVPIVAGTRVTEAEARPPVPAIPPRPPIPARPAAHAEPPACPVMAAPAAPSPAAVAAKTWTIEGLPSANERRAENAAMQGLQAQVLEWLSPDVPASWTPPDSMLRPIVAETRIDEIEKSYGTVYVAHLTAHAPPELRAQLVDAYNRDLIQHRLMTLGGTLAFVLICLAAISGYIRADEATKGYYTNRLRMLAAAGVGAAGVIVYKMVA
jgi:hypothetical protein